MSGEALYVYAITDATVRFELGSGIEGRSVEAVQQGRLLALVHRMHASPYVGPDHQVQRWALEHSRVVERAWNAADTVLPVTFDVLVAPLGEMSAAERLRSWLGEHTTPLEDRLDALRGRVELKVELAFDAATIRVLHDQDPSLNGIRQELVGRSPGVRRLLEKKVEVAERSAVAARARECTDRAARRLAALATEMIERRPVARGDSEHPVASFSLLVARSDIDPVGAELSAIQRTDPALRIRFLGPWPPYSFADVNISA